MLANAPALGRVNSSLDIFFAVIPNKRRLPYIQSALPINWALLPG
jgi:hypothetical protein